MQNAESDTDRGDHNKSEEGVVALVIACLSTAKFLEAIKETLYYIPPLIRLFIKQPRLLCVYFRRDRKMCIRDRLWIARDGPFVSNHIAVRVRC